MDPWPHRDDLTGLLRRAAGGDQVAAEEFFGKLYPLLRDMALGQMNGSRGDTLQPTALVHEAWLRISKVGESDWRDREHFLALAARAMRSTLVDHARKRGTRKRGGGSDRIPLDEALRLFENQSTDLVALDDALERLAQRDANQARLVELRFFSGMTMEEAARALDVSLATAERHWYAARAWLRRELAG